MTKEQQSTYSTHGIEWEKEQRKIAYASWENCIKCYKMSIGLDEKTLTLSQVEHATAALRSWETVVEKSLIEARKNL